MRYRMTFSNCLSTRQSFPKKNELMTSLVLNFQRLKYLHACRRLISAHSHNSKNKIQDPKKKKMQNCVNNVLLIVFKGRVFISDHS